MDPGLQGVLRTDRIDERRDIDLYQEQAIDRECTFPNQEWAPFQADVIDLTQDDGALCVIDSNDRYTVAAARCDIQPSSSGGAEAGLETPRVLPSVAAYTVQCASCLKWRLMPTKQKYEQIRESILQKPFLCVQASSWRPGASCDEPADLSQDTSHLWAIDKPNIPVPPDGWERLLVLRGLGASKFADVYYIAPSGKKLRSVPDVERFLLENPHYVSEGVRLSQFSFVIPRPLDKNYVKKRDGPSGEMRGSMAKKPKSNCMKRKQGEKALLGFPILDVGLPVMGEPEKVSRTAKLPMWGGCSQGVNTGLHSYREKHVDDGTSQSWDHKNADQDIPATECYTSVDGPWPCTGSTVQPNPCRDLVLYNPECAMPFCAFHFAGSMISERSLVPK